MLQKKVGKVPVVWLLTGAVLFLFLIGLVVEGAVSFAGISTTRASVGEFGTKVEEMAAEAEQVRTELERASTELGDLKGKIALQEERMAGFQLQVLLLKASGKALKARIHLAEEEAGLAKRDLRECDVALEAAMAFADEETKASLKELRASITELREGIEAETFPLTTLEILIDRIDNLIGQ